MRSGGSRPLSDPLQVNTFTTKAKGLTLVSRVGYRYFPLPQSSSLARAGLVFGMSSKQGMWNYGRITLTGCGASRRYAVAAVHILGLSSMTGPERPPDNALA